MLYLRILLFYLINQAVIDVFYAEHQNQKSEVMSTVSVLES